MPNLKYLIEYGLYLLVFLLPWQTRWIIRAGEIGGEYSEYGTISLYGTDILLIILIFLFGLTKIFNFQFSIFKQYLISNFQYKNFLRSKIFKLYKNYWWLILGLVFLSFISIFFAPDKLLAIYHFGWLLLGIGLFWIITTAPIDKLKLIYAFLGGVFIQASLGLWQFFTQSSSANKWLGLAMHDAGALGTSVVEAVGPDGIGERWLRAYGGLDHPNVLGALLTVGGLILLFLLIKQSNPPRPTATPPREGTFQLLTSYFLLLIFTVSLFFTFSRGAWLGLAAGLVVMMAMAVLKKDYIAQKKILSAILAGGVSVFILFNIYSNLVLTRLAGETRLEAKSTEERLASYGEARQIIKKNWLIGAGIGNYVPVIYDVGFRIYEQSMGGRGIGNPKSKIINLKYLQPVHNTFLLIWAETGIFGLLSFLGLLLVISYQLLVIGRKNFKPSYLVALIIALMVMMTVDHFWWSLHFGVLLLWFILGTVKRYSKQTGE